MSGNFDATVYLNMPHPDLQSLVLGGLATVIVLASLGVVVYLFVRAWRADPDVARQTDAYPTWTYDVDGWEDGEFEDDDYWETAPLHERLRSMAMMVDSHVVASMLLEASTALEPEQSTQE